MRPGTRPIINTILALCLIWPRIALCTTTPSSVEESSKPDTTPADSDSNTNATTVATSVTTLATSNAQSTTNNPTIVTDSDAKSSAKGSTPQSTGTTTIGNNTFTDSKVTEDPVGSTKLVASVGNSTEESTLNSKATTSNPTTNTTEPNQVTRTSEADTGDIGEGDHHKEGIVLIPVHFSHVKNPLIITLVVIIAGMSKLAFHFSHFLSSKVPESCVLIVLGVVFGIIFHFSGASANLKLYEPHEFFLFLLPPIILEAAFSLHDRTFAENLGSVLLFAVLGTVLNCFIIGLSLYGLYVAGAMEEINTNLVQLLVFSALIVAVDPVAVLAVFQEVGVNSTLYYLVFGESLLNDGVTVVLYNVLQILNTMDEITAGQIALGIVKFFIVVTCGLLIGVVCGLLSSFITKYTNSVKVVEPLIIFGFAYLSYIVSEIFEFSGIISIIACGIIQVHYAFHNITNKSRLAVKFFAKVMASANEIIIFMFLGLVTVNPNHDWKTGFTLWTIVLCIITRFAVTFSISIMIDKYASGVRKIKLDEMFMISYGGLRGAVCFSLVALIDENEIPSKNMFVTTTLFVIFFTVFIQGGTIKWLVKKMRVSLADKKEDMKLNEELATHVFDHIMAGIEEILGYTHGTHHIKMKLDQIDEHIIRPKLLRNATNTDLDDISHYYEKLVMKEHYKNLHLAGAKLRRVTTEIRHLDSELALEKLDKDHDEHEVHERHHERIMRRDQKHLEKNKSYGHSIHKFFSHTMHTVRSQMHMQVHDRNLVHERKHNLVAYLRKKHRRNKELSRIKNKDDGVHLPGTMANLTVLNEGLGAEGLEMERKTSQVRFQIEEDSESADESNGASNGKHIKHKSGRSRSHKSEDISLSKVLLPGSPRNRHKELHIRDDALKLHDVRLSQNSSEGSMNEYLEFMCGQYDGDHSSLDISPYEEERPLRRRSLIDINHPFTDSFLNVHVNPGAVDNDDTSRLVEKGNVADITETPNVTSTADTKKASSYKSAMYPVAGAIIGTVVGGPVGLLAGGLAGVVGGTAEFFNERLNKDNKEEEEVAIIERSSPSRSKSMTDVSPKKVATRSWFGLRSLNRHSDCRAYCLDVHQNGVFDV